MKSENGMISKHPVSELHQGHIHSPLTALGAQEVKVSDGGGSKKPSVSRGSQQMPKGAGRSVAKEAMYAEKRKS